MSPVGVGDVFPPLPAPATSVINGRCITITKSGRTRPALVGPIRLYHLDPQLGVGADVTTPWGRSVSYAGYASRAAAEQLNELVANPTDPPTTIPGYTGVMLPITRDPGDEMPGFDGMYLLTACNISATWVHMAGGTEGVLPFTLAGILLSGSFQPVLIRSARTRPNVYGLDGRATVASPYESVSGGGFAQSTGGGPSFTREYNAAMEGETPLPAVALVSPGSTLAVDTLLGVVVPILAGPTAGSQPDWATRHGGRPRGYDRRQMRQVYGADHAFASATDAQITNGLLTLWCGARGMPAHVGVSAFYGGAERQVGNLSLSDTDDILGVRIVRVSADVVSMAVAVRNAGDVVLSLRRASRYVDIAHGDLRPPAPLVTRTVRWLGMAPARRIAGVSATTTARYGAGVALASGGQLGFAWPTTQPVTSWSYGQNWTPSAASTSQPDSGLWSVWAGGSAVGVVRWDAATKTIRWTQGANTLVSAALTFSAGDAVSWLASFSDETGMALTTSVNGGVATTVVAATSVDPGTAAVAFDSHWIGATTSGFGSDPFGTGPFGGSPVTADLGGAVSNAMLFDGPLSAAEAAALLASTSRLGGLPLPWSRLVGYWPFEARPIPVGSPVTTGRRFEATTDGGTTRSPDASGLTKGIAGLGTVSAGTSGRGFGLSASTTKQMLVGAYLATTATNDDLADHHLELAAANRVIPSAR